MTNQEIQERARQAKYILESEVFRDVVHDLGISYLQAWERTKDQEVVEREVCYRKHIALQEVKRELNKLLNAAKILEKSTK